MSVDRAGFRRREEHLFVPPDGQNAELAAHLTRRFVGVWLPAARLPAHRFDDALETVELKVAPDDEQGRWCLRARSFCTGTTYWLYEWDGSRELGRSMDRGDG